MQKLLKSIKNFPSYDHKCTATYFCETQYIMFRLRIVLYYLDCIF